MMRRLFFYICILFFSVCAFSSCIENDDFSSNSSYKLSFSVDTVKFDTVFSTITSITARLKVYNHNRHCVRISSVGLAGGANSPFKINVLGQNNSQQSFSDVELSSGDSLYVFVQVTINPNNVNNPVLFMDSINFMTNGNHQAVQLEAVGQDVVIYKNKTFESDMTLNAEKPYLIFGDLTVTEGKTLNIEEGCKMYFHDKSGVVVNGTLNALGTIAKPIVMCGDRMDCIFKGVPYDSICGQWKGIVFNSQGVHTLKNVEMRSGTNAIDTWIDTTFTPIVQLENCIIHNFKGYGIAAKKSNITAVNTVISNCGTNCLFIAGGTYDFVHCTIASFIAKSIKSGTAVYLRNYDVPEKEVEQCPLTAVFKNCIIFGSYDSELTLSDTYNKEKVSAMFAPVFEHCLLVGQSSTENYYSNCVWALNTAKVFNHIVTYPYSFMLCANSSAINVADVAVSSTCPLDIKGNSRLSDGFPDIGAYEYVSAK